MLATLGILVASFTTRCWNIAHPWAVVFDELHYIKFITLYSKRIFFFDPQPPLGKQLFTLFAYLVGFRGDLTYTQIGDSYKQDAPIHLLRLLPALCGGFIAPLCYIISLQLGFRKLTSVLVSLLVILENSLLTQSRFILLDSMLIMFSLCGLYCFIRFTKSLSEIWLILACVATTLAVCTKYSGLYSYAMLVTVLWYTWWNQIDKMKLENFATTTLRYCVYLFVVPTTLYISIYFAHLSWLSRAGPHDSIMTSAFQASLEGGLASITRGQPLEIVHGSQITLRHTHGRSCWLHSHEHLYPVKYGDGRGSSHQQQVTCYSFKDVNNWWIVKRPHTDDLVVTEPLDKIKNGDLIQLIHGMTGRTLNSHDVAAAMNPYSQEVSCYVDHNISMPAQNVWRVNLLNPGDTNDHWHTINSRLQLIHLNSSVVMRYSGRQLPDWGFHQHEIVADKELKSDDSIWNVEEHRYTKSEDQEVRGIHFSQAEFVTLEPTSLTLLDKFLELHYKLIVHQQDSLKDHIYASESPLDWLLMSKGTAYWVDNRTSEHNAQIFLIGNISISMIGLMAILILVCFVLSYSVRRRRQIMCDLDEVTWSKFQFQALILLAGYFMNVVPYFLYDGPLFLQYYLSAIIYKILIIGAVTDHLYDLPVAKPIAINSLSIFILAKAAYSFYKLMPLSFGHELTSEEVENLRWKDTWQLLVINP